MTEGKQENRQEADLVDRAHNAAARTNKSADLLDRAHERKGNAVVVQAVWQRGDTPEVLFHAAGEIVNPVASIVEHRDGDPRK